MGTDQQGQQCGTSASDLCAPGMVCVQNSPTVSSCLKFCDTDSDCEAPGGLCLFTLNNGMDGGIMGVTLCSENCDPTTNTGCPAGTACQLLQESTGQKRFLTMCESAGTAVKDQVCNPMGYDCAAKFGCFNTGSSDMCLQYCNVNAPACPNAGLCSPLQNMGAPIMLGSITFGVCE